MQRGCVMRNPAGQARRVALRRCPAASNGATASSNGVSSTAKGKPSAAETARTIVDIVSEGTLSTLSPDGVPVGSPVSYIVDKQGATWIALSSQSPEARNLKANSKCSLMIQPRDYPARAVAAVTIIGSVQVDQQEQAAGLRLNVDKALYYGGLDQVRPRLPCNHLPCDGSMPGWVPGSRIVVTASAILHADGCSVCQLPSRLRLQSEGVQEVSAADLQAAEPDVLRAAAPELVRHWNE